MGDLAQTLCVTATHGALIALRRPASKTAQLSLEVVERLVGVWGSQSVGYKLPPHFAGYSMSDSSAPETFSYSRGAVEQPADRYLHIGEAMLSMAPLPHKSGDPHVARTNSVARDRDGGYDAHSGMP